jgi:hypothetical protein
MYRSAMAFGAIAFGFYVVIRNWSDYRETLAARRASLGHGHEGGSLRKGSPRQLK